MEGREIEMLCINCPSGIMKAEELGWWRNPMVCPECQSRFYKDKWFTEAEWMETSFCICCGGTVCIGG